MAEFLKSDFEKLRFRVDLIDVLNCDILHSFPEIRYFPEFSEGICTSLGLKFSQVFAYICLAYDMNSPYVKKYDDIIKRKKTVADAVLFRRKQSGDFIPEVNKLISCEFPEVNRMIIRFCRMLKSDEWTSHITYQEAKKNAELLLLDPKLESQDKKTNFDISVKLRKEIQELKQYFLADDANRNLVNSLYDAIDEEELMTPEFVALKDFQREHLELFNPYVNKIPINKYMERLLEGASTFEWDNPDLVPKESEDE